MRHTIIFSTSYRNTVGVEPQYSYQIAGIARAGTAYISDATLHQTMVVPLLASASEVMPFSLSLVYNSVYGNRVFKQDSTMLHTKPFTNMNLGAGWKLSVQESVCSLTVNSTTFLIYTDADGTEHYFRKLSGSTYQDEDGLGLKITVSGSDFTMTDDYGNTKFFGNGYLKQQYDAYGNYLYFNYNGDAQLSTIKRRNKDSTVEETLASFTYNASTKRLTSITDEAGRTLSLTYTTLGSTYSLSRIQFADGAKMQYTYSACADGAYRMVTAYDAEAGYGMEFGYAAGGVINSFAEYVGTSKAYGAKFSAEKLSHNQTRYCYYGKDGTKGGTDDIYTHKVLDTLGRTINSYSTDYTQKHILGVGVSNYKTNSGTSKQNNRLTANASAGQQGVNLLKNASVENSSVGINENYGWSSIGNAALDTNAYLGEVSLCFNRSTASSTVDQWYQEVTLEAGKAYTFSAYVNVPKSVSFSDGGGIYLAFQNSSGNCLKTGETLNYSTADMNGGWVRLTVTYTNNATAAVNLRAAVCADHYTGSIYADAMQLEEEDAASTFNLVENGSFEHTVTIADSSSYYWYKTGTADVTDTEATYFGTKTLRLSGESGYQRISRDISVNAPLDSTFILSAWAKAAATPKSGATQGISESELSSYFGLILRFYYSDGSSEAHYYPFDPYYRDWQYVQGIAVPQKTGSATIESITIVAAYEKNINSAYIDNISFRMEPVQTYTYDENGNLETAAQTGNGTASATYDGVDLTQYTAANQNKYTYTYNNAHDVLTTTVDGVTATNTYSTAGNILTSVLSNSTNSLIIKSSATATTDKNHTASVTDANGNKTTYTYDSGTEQLTSVKNAKNVTTTYTYDTAGRTTKVEHPKASIRYFYQNGQLSTLGRTTQNAAGSNVYQGYTFETNAWGQITAVNIATSANGTTWTDQIELASYTYNNCGTGGNGGGNLAQMTYGNGDTVSYTYDDLDRLTRRSYNDGRYVIYEYNAEGQLAQLTYGDNGMEDMTFAFEYDSLGRLIRSTQSDSDNLYQRTEHIYDSYGRLSKQSWIIGGRSYSESYTYDDGTDGDGSLKTMRTGTGDIRSYTYDTLKRLQKVTVTNGGTEILSTAYAYRDISATQTTPQVQYRNVRDAYGTIIEGKKYEYDALGNITKISQSESPYQPLIVYHYDSQNQLISEIYYDGNGSATTNITVAYYYNYDTAGNLLTVQEGRVDANGSLTKTVIQSYTYSNGAWKDLLTSVTVDGTVYNISYDGSGNPETYGNWEFSWQRGRQLCTAGTSTDTTDTNLSYAYDADGIRTSKRYTVSTYEDIPQYTVTFKADGVTVKTMTVEDGYVLQTGDYPAVPAKTGYTGSWQRHTAAIHSNITVQAAYTINRYTVNFVADGTTVKTMTVDYGYVLQDGDYPTVPEKTGYTGSWQQYTAAIHSDITVQATYTINRYTVNFVADGTTVKTMTVDYGYVLQDSDYPAVPEKTGYTGEWLQYTEAVCSDVTIQAAYSQIMHMVTFVADGTTVMTMTVNDGYVLQESDYPTVPAKTGYTGVWQQYTTAIHADVTIEAVYAAIQHTVTFIADNTTVSTLTVGDGYVLQESDYPSIPAKGELVGHWEEYTAAIYADVTLEAIYCNAYHKVTFTARKSTSKGEEITIIKEMTVSDGYKLTDSDYPEIPERTGYKSHWEKYTAAIHRDIMIMAIYKHGVDIPPQPTDPPVIMSVDDSELMAIDASEEELAVTDSVAAASVAADAGISAENEAALLSTHEGQVLVSTQTVEHDYVTQNGKVVRETVRTNGTVTAVMDFIYDESGRPFALKYSSNGGSTFTTYYYILNLQGDVVKLVQILASPSGIQEYSEVASYTYDAWGNILSSTGNMADINPLRYRGYYYDTETGFYYLQSRYYDPVTHRFINADSYGSTGQGFVGTNMFAYCNNEPVMHFDSTGYSPFSTLKYYSDCSYSIPADNVSPSDPTIRDVTDEINAALSRAAAEGRAYREHAYCSSFCVDCCIDCLSVEPKRYMSFYDLVDHYAPWDIKRKDPWENTIGTEFPGENVQVKYCGMLMTPEALGNYTYGYLGHAYGIPLVFLRLGSWYAADFPTSGPALDNERIDQEYIKFGYFCYYTLAID